MAMLEQDGIEMIQALRLSHPRVNAIAISGQFGGPMLRVAELLGTDVSLSKPISPNLLVDTVRRIMPGTIVEKEIRPEEQV